MANLYFAKVNAITSRPALFIFVTTFALLCGCLCTHPIFAQDYAFKSLTTKDGLPSASIYRIVPDREGYLWMATQNGICRYNGRSIQVYGSERGFDDYGAYHIEMDNSGRLWFNSLSFKLYSLEGDKLVKYDTTRRNIYWIKQSSNGTIWIADRQDTITRISNGVTRRIFIPSGNNIIRNMIADNDRLLVYSGLYFFMIENDVARLLPCPFGPFYQEATRMFRLRSGDVLINWPNGLLRYSWETNSFSVGAMLEKNFLSSHILCFYEDSTNGDLWVGHTRGVYRFRGGHLARSYSEEFLKGEAVTSVSRDFEGRYWFSTQNSGALYLDDFNVTSLNTSTGLSDNHITYLIPSSNGISLVNQRGPTDFLPDPGKPVHKSAGLSDNGVALGLSLINDKCALIHAFPNPYILCDGRRRILPYTSVNTYSVDRQGHLTSIDYDRVLSTIDESKWILTQRVTLKHRRLPEMGRLQTHLISKKGTWLGCQYGLLLCDTAGREKQYPFENEMNNANIIQFLTSDGNDLIMATKNRGVIILNDRGITVVDRSNGLLSNTCNRIYLSGDTLWVCTGSGLNRLVLDRKLHVTSNTPYTTNNGLPTNEINDIIRRNGKMYVATTAGLVIFNDSFRYVNNVPPPVYIDAVYANDSLISNTGSVNLAYNENSLRINYQGISYKSNGNLSYRYMLKGIEDKWIYTTLSSLQYNALPGGSYTFIVYAANSDGVWSTVPATFSFHISPPIWKRWWFITLLILLGCLLVYFYFQQGKERIRKERDYIESQLRSLRLQINPHFIFNTLNSLQSFILKGDAIAANTYISKFSKLIRLILEQSKKNLISLEEELAFLDMYVQLEQLRFDKNFSYVLTVDETINPGDVFIPSLVIQPFVENAIKYGLAAKKPHEMKVLSLTVKRTGTYLLCLVQDNGIGRDASIEMQRLSGKEYESTGIKFTTERLRFMSGNKIDEPVKIVDLYDEQNEPAGTRVEIKIAFQTDKIR